jgi:hopanoid biosynthesis associated protein HpnK
MVRQLIINADDLGLTNGVNRAIIETHNRGVVTSATLMAHGAAFEDAIQLIGSAPRLSVGCHVVLTDGMPVLPPDAIPTLLASRSGEPDKFHSRLSALAARAVFGGFHPDELTNEIVAQVKKLQRAGVHVTHVDTHKHTHIFPVILKALVKGARICGVPAVRNPFVPANALRVRQFRGKPLLWKRFGQVRMLRTFAGRFRERMRKSGLSTPDGIIGIIETGEFNLTRLREALQDLPDGTWELVCHPGYNDDDLQRARTRLRESRELERKLLTSPELRQFLDEQRIQLMGYGELASTGHSVATSK